LTAPQLIESAEKNFGLVSLMAKDLDVAPQTVRNYMKRYVSVANAVQEQREALIDRGELALRDAIARGENWAVTLILKTLGRSRGYGDSVNVDGNIAATIKIEYVNDTTA